MTAKFLSISALLALLVCAPTLCSQQPERPPSGRPSNTQAPPGQPQQKTSPTVPAASRIELKQPLSEKDPAIFARRLSDLLGAKVRLPTALSATLTLPAGVWRADELLDQVGAQIMAAVQAQGRWRHVFVFTPIAKESPPPVVSRLSSVGVVTVNKQEVPFAEIAHAIVHAVGSRVKLPEAVPGRYTLRCEGVAAERALAQLAAQAGLAVSVMVVFDAPSVESTSRVTEEELKIEKQLAVQAEESQKMLAELERIRAVQEATGMDPLDASFNWDGVDAGVWQGLGLSAKDVAAFRRQMEEEIENQRQVELISAEMVSGRNGEIGNVDPKTGEPRPDPVTGETPP